MGGSSCSALNIGGLLFVSLMSVIVGIGENNEVFLYQLLMRPVHNVQQFLCLLAGWFSQYQKCTNHISSILVVSTIKRMDSSPI